MGWPGEGGMGWPGAGGCANSGDVGEAGEELLVYPPRFLYCLGSCGGGWVRGC
jgi:hypothetical protein